MPADLILVVDDEPNIIELTRLYLEREGYQVITAADGLSALELIREQRPALVVLDVMLPGLDGFEVCRRVRANDDRTAIVMLTARDDDIDKIVGLELGADDYLTKPFNPRELVARVKAIFRRANPANPAVTVPGGQIRVGDLIVDPDRREVQAGGEQVELRTQEFDLLLVLVQNQGKVLTREKLLDLAWGFDFAGQTRTVDVHVAQIRRKLAASQVRIETVTGMGYKLVP